MTFLELRKSQITSVLFKIVLMVQKPPVMDMASVVMEVKGMARVPVSEDLSARLVRCV